MSENIAKAFKAVTVAYNALAPKVGDLVDASHLNNAELMGEAAKELYKAITIFGYWCGQDERARALEPREPPPGLELAERLIRFDGERARWLGPVEMRALASELDRLRAEIVVLREANQPRPEIAVEKEVIHD